MDIMAALEIGLIAIVFTFFFVDVFDNTGTLVAVAHKAGLIGEDGKLPRIGRAFGFITYAGIKLLSGRWSELNAALVILAVLFVLKFALL